MRNRVLTEINTALVHDLLYLERHQNRKTLGGQGSERIDFSDANRKDRVQSVRLLELQRSHLAHVLSRSREDCLGIQVELLFGICRHNHRHNGKHHALVSGRQVVQELLGLLTLELHIIRNDGAEIVVLILLALPVGDIGSVIRVSAGGRDRLNAMYMVDGYGENNPIVVKSEFIMSLIEQIDKKGVGPQHKSIIDRCITNVYRNAAEDGTVPTLCTLRDMLLEQPEPEAKQIALSLELYTTGSLDIFGKQSNVDLDKRIVVFDIHGLGSQLKPTGLLVITDTMLNRVTLNWKKGKRTHVFIDEFHVVFENEFSAQFFNSAWRQFRKRNAYPTAITQNVEYLLDSVQASTMLSNSEFVIMLNQAASDREKLARLLNISNEQMSYITNADAGCGLIKYGSALVPFINQFPHDTKLYQLMTTRPGEGEFARGQD